MRKPHLILVLSILFCACGREQSGADRQLSWRIEHVWSVGGATDNAISLSDVEPFQVASNGVDEIYVLDRMSSRVFALDLQGAVIDTLGMKGSGPGEFEDPWAIAVDQRGTVAVLDVGNRRVVRWGADGRVLDALPVREMIEHPKMVVQSGEVLFTMADHSRDGPREFRLMAFGPTASRILARLERPPLRLGNLPSCHATDISLVPIFMPAIHWDAAGDRVAVNSGPEYQIQLYRSGVVSGTAHRPIAPVAATQALAEAEVGAWRFNDCLVPPAEVVQASGFRNVVPVIQALALSPQGDLWVLRHTEDGTHTAVDLFDSTGAYQGTLQAGGLFPAAFIGLDRIVVVEKGVDDIPRVSLYAIARR